MIEGSLSRRYTKALFNWLGERARGKIGQEIESFLEAYRRAVADGSDESRLGMDSRKRVVIEISNKLQLSILAIHFLSLLLERDRLTYLPSIVARYRRLLNEAKGRVEAKAVGASALEAAMLDRLREVLHGISGKEIVLHQEIDPGLIGGVLLEFEGKVYDGSVRTQLANMKQRIARGY